MNLNPISSIVESVGKVADDLFTSDEERAKLDLEARRIDAEIVKGQLEVNKAEASHSSVFVSGARPAILWVGAGAMAWTFIMHPIMVWMWAFFQAQGWVPTTLAAPPTLESETLWVIVSGILGLGGARTFEKVKGVASK